MRIGIFVLMAGRNAGGPETYEIQLIRSLARIDDRNEYLIYCTGTEAVEAIGVRQENFTYRVLRPGIRPLSVGVTLPLMLVKDGIDFYHATFTPPPYSSKPLAFTMHCVSSLVHPEFYRKSVALRLNHLLRHGMAQARQIICVSRTTLHHLHEMYGLPLERMSVAYNGVGPEFVPVPVNNARKAVEAAYGVKEPYILFVGKMQAHKNVERLLEAFRQVRCETNSRLKLILAGRPAGNAVDVEGIAHRLQIREHVVVTGYVPGAMLPMLYSAARMFVFPSLWEGFGIPVIEAMSCRTPVIASNVTCLPEICGDAAVTVDPTSPTDLADAISKVDGSESERSRLIAAGIDRARCFSWDNCARDTLATYARFLS